MDQTPATPAPTPGTGPAAPGEGLVEYVRTNRQNAGILLLTLSALFLAVGVWAVVKYRSLATEAAASKDEKKDEKPLDPFNPDAAPTKVTDPSRGDYIVGAIGCAFLFLVGAAGGAWLMARPPAPTDAQQRSDVRGLLLTLGGVAGMALIVLGGAFFYLWAGALNDWLEKGEAKQARWVLFPLLIVATGAGLAFLAAQPARADERNNSTIRRLVYGTNLGLSVLLLFVALVVANVALGRKVPNKLDTTESGFYSLAAGTEEFLARLDQPATAYAILSGQSRTSDDIRRLLETMADVPGTKFKAKFLSPTQNKGELGALRGKYPTLEVNDFGVLLTVGDDEKRHSFIREDEFSDRERATAPGQESARTFVGEARIMKEMQFLTENQQKAVVYFTQSSGELDISGGGPEGGEAARTASAGRLKAALERNFLDVRPLRFDLANPTVPADANVVVVAEPRSSFPEPVVAALRKYMTQPLPDGRKGKLILLAGAQFGPDRRVMKTGLEGLLAEFNVNLPERVIYCQPTREFEAEEPLVGFSGQAVRARNPVAVTLGEKAVFLAPFWRPVGAGQGAPTGPFRATPLMVTSPGRYTWFETERPASLERAISELQERRDVQRAKELSEGARTVAQFVTEEAPPTGERREPTGRVMVIGNGVMFSDAFGGQDGRDPVTFDLLSATIDWFRDRPSLGIGVEAKKYKTFMFPATADDTRGLWFPLLFTLIVVGGAGAGVWVVRRK